VDKHLEQIYAKLGVENRTAAAAIAANATRRILKSVVPDKRATASAIRDP